MAEFLSRATEDEINIDVADSFATKRIPIGDQVSKLRTLTSLATAAGRGG